MPVPVLTDRHALARARARARARAHPGDSFLHQLARDEIEERLKDVNRRFTAPALVTGFPEFWADMLPFTAISPDDPELTLESHAHDLVIHAMGLHWADDPVGQLIQCRRALVRDGWLLSVSFGGETLHELRAALAQADEELGGAPARRIVPMGEVRDLGGLLQRAGLALPVADLVTQRTSYPDLAGLMHELRAMGEQNALAERPRRFASRRVFERAEAIYRAENAEGGRLVATWQLAFLAGWAPAPSQQQPLRPGTARARLAHVLGTQEHKLKGS